MICVRSYEFIVRLPNVSDQYFLGKTFFCAAGMPHLLLVATLKILGKFEEKNPRIRHLFRNCQNATADAAATLRESTWCDMGMRTT